MIRYKSFILLTIAVLPIFIASLFLFLKDPPVWPDDATSLYQAQTLLETGRMKAFNYGGIPIEAKRSGLAFPPLYFAILGVWTMFAGTSIEAIRSLSLVIGALCVILFYFVIKLSLRATEGSVAIFQEDRHALPAGRQVAAAPRDDRLLPFFGALLLSSSVTFGQATRFARPEILTLFLWITSLFFWYYSQRLHKIGSWIKSGMTVSLSYICAALATACHPMGFLAPTTLFLAILFSSFSKKKKLFFVVTLGACVAVVTFLWIGLTQESLTDLYKAFTFGLKDEAYSSISWLVFISSDPVWSTLIISQWIVFLNLFIKIIKTRENRKEFIFILTAAIFVLIAVTIQNVIYYALYTMPFIILAILAVIKPLRLIPRLSIVGFFILVNIILQFFHINSYTPTGTIFTLQGFDYHGFSREIKNHLPKTKITLFIASIPDPSIDLQTNPNYTIHLAIDPNYTLDLEDYKKTLDATDYVIYSWLPHDFLARYVDANAESIETITQEDGYTAQIAKLKSLKERR